MIDDTVSGIKNCGDGVSTVFYNGGKNSFPVGNDRIAAAGLVQGAKLVFGSVADQGQGVYCNDEWLATIG